MKASIMSIIPDFLERKELEKKIIRDFRKELAISKKPLKKNYGFSYNSHEKLA